MSWQRIESRTDVAATVAALAVLPLIAAEVIARSPTAIAVVLIVNWTVWFVFLADAVAKLGVHGLRWLRRPSAWLAVAIIVISVPLFGNAAAGARVVRAAQLARLARLGRLGRLGRLVLAASRALHGLERMLRPEALPYVTLATAGIVTIGGAALYLVEFQPDGHANIGDALWWAMTTVTTVGYGDIVPKSATGRLVGAAVMVLGIAYTSLLTAELAAHMTKRDKREDTAGLAARVDALAADVRTLHDLIVQSRDAGQSAIADGDDVVPPPPKTSRRQPD